MGASTWDDTPPPPPLFGRNLGMDGTDVDEGDVFERLVRYLDRTCRNIPLLKQLQHNNCGFAPPLDGFLHDKDPSLADSTGTRSVSSRLRDRLTATNWPLIPVSTVTGTHSLQVRSSPTQPTNRK